jgi:hypothetical protein
MSDMTDEELAAFVKSDDKPAVSVRYEDLPQGAGPMWDAAKHGDIGDLFQATPDWLKNINIDAGAKLAKQVGVTDPDKVGDKANAQLPWYAKAANTIGAAVPAMAAASAAGGLPAVAAKIPGAVGTAAQLGARTLANPVIQGAIQGAGYGHSQGDTAGGAIAGGVLGGVLSSPLVHKAAGAIMQYPQRALEAGYEGLGKAFPNAAATMDKVPDFLKSARVKALMALQRNADPIAGDDAIQIVRREAPAETARRMYNTLGNHAEFTDNPATGVTDIRDKLGQLLQRYDNGEINQQLGKGAERAYPIGYKGPGANIVGYDRPFVTPKVVGDEQVVSAELSPKEFDQKIGRKDAVFTKHQYDSAPPEAQAAFQKHLADLHPIDEEAQKIAMKKNEAYWKELRRRRASGELPEDAEKLPDDWDLSKSYSESGRQRQAARIAKEMAQKQKDLAIKGAPANALEDFLKNRADEFAPIRVDPRDNERGFVDRGGLGNALKRSAPAASHADAAQQLQNIARGRDLTNLALGGGVTLGGPFHLTLPMAGKIAGAKFGADALGGAGQALSAGKLQANPALRAALEQLQQQVRY